jgi:hypothetical protein
MISWDLCLFKKNAKKRYSSIQKTRKIGETDPPKIDLSNISGLASIADGKKTSKKRLF